MSTEQNVTLARRYFEDLCNGRRPEVADEILAPDFVYYDPQIPNVVGPKATVQAVAVYQDSLDGHWQIEDIVAAGEDKVVARWTGTGIHHADMMGIPATGKSIKVAAISLFRIADGKIAEQWTVWDTLGLLQQIGVVPAPQQAVAV